MRAASGVAAGLMIAGAIVLAAARPGGATVGIEERARKAGYPADDCAWCHSFSRDHMTKHAREAGLRSTNCITCHGNALPLDGVDLFNDRGRFLLERKKERKAKEVDVRWLADYVEPPAEEPPPPQR